MLQHSPVTALEPRLHQYGKKVYSQNNEDGIIAHLVSRLPMSRNFFVEFGVGPPYRSTLQDSGLEANCRLLRERGWYGLFMDGGVFPTVYNVRREIVTALNINELFRKYRVPEDFDLLSIDIDGQDLWVWLALMYAPKIVVIEYNANLMISESKAIPFDLNYRWDGSRWFGASLLALDKVGTGKGYVLVYANGVNAFFVRRDLLANAEDFAFSEVYVGKIVHHADPLDRPWVTI